MRRKSCWISLPIRPTFASSKSSHSASTRSFSASVRSGISDSLWQKIVAQPRVQGLEVFCGRHVRRLEIELDLVGVLPFGIAGELDAVRLFAAQVEDSFSRVLNRLSWIQRPYPLHLQV